MMVQMEASRRRRKRAAEVPTPSAAATAVVYRQICAVSGGEKIFVYVKYGKLLIKNKIKIIKNKIRKNMQKCRQAYHQFVSHFCSAHATAVVHNIAGPSLTLGRRRQWRMLLNGIGRPDGADGIKKLGKKKIKKKM